MRLRTRNSTATPTPYVVPPTERFEGNDGSWSTFYINVGSPDAQNFRVLVSIASSLIWVVGENGCTPNDPSDCPDLRGIENYAGTMSSGYNPSFSSSSPNSTEIGLYGLMLEEDTTLSTIYGSQYSQIPATFYKDVAGLGLGSSQSSLQLSGDVFATFMSKDIFLGEFGLGISPYSFQGKDYPQTFLSGLVNTSEPIPSLSYGYTAGASYQNYYGNLVLGGYDASRFTFPANSYQFLPYPNNTIVTFVQSIIVSTNDGSWSTTTDATGYSYSFPAQIDSTLPYLWLPNEVVSRFVDIFGLRYDSETELYTINATQRTSNLNNNASVQIIIAESATSSNLTYINLSYQAFDQSASWPIYNSSTTYFPIRNSSTGIFVLGRTLLQESYLVVDYERRNWSLGRAEFPSSMPPPNVVPILSPQTTNNTNITITKTHQNGSGVSTGVIAGVVIAIVAIMSAITFAYFCFRRRRSKQPPMVEVDATSRPANAFSAAGFYSPVGEPKSSVSELASEIHAKEWVEYKSNHSRVHSGTSYELSSVDQELPVELEAYPVTPPLVSPEVESPPPDAHDRNVGIAVRERRRSSDNAPRRVVWRPLNIVRETEVDEEDEDGIERVPVLPLMMTPEPEEDNGKRL